MSGMRPEKQPLLGGKNTGMPCPLPLTTVPEPRLANSQHSSHVACGLSVQLLDAPREGRG